MVECCTLGHPLKMKKKKKKIYHHLHYIDVHMMMMIAIVLSSSSIQFIQFWLVDRSVNRERVKLFISIYYICLSNLRFCCCCCWKTLKKKNFANYFFYHYHYGDVCVKGPFIHSFIFPKVFISSMILFCIEICTTTTSHLSLSSKNNNSTTEIQQWLNELFSLVLVLVVVVPLDLSFDYSFWLLQSTNQPTTR